MVEIPSHPHARPATGLEHSHEEQVRYPVPGAEYGSHLAPLAGPDGSGPRDWDRPPSADFGRVAQVQLRVPEGAAATPDFDVDHATEAYLNLLSPDHSVLSPDPLTPDP